MANVIRTTRFRFWLWLIAFIGVIVPRRLRADWRQEWEAELRYREQLLAEWDRLNWRSKLDLLRRSIGAFWDALLLQPRRLEDDMFQDLRFGMRMLLKQPGFTLIVVITLAFGIGANTAVFSVVNAALLRPLPYQNPERLVAISESDAQQKVSSMAVAGPNFLDWRSQAQTFERMAAFDGEEEFNLTGGEFPEKVNGARVSQDFFATLGVAPVLGRAFLPAEAQPGAPPVVMLSHALWQRRFGGDRGVIGQAIRVDGESATVVGVMPPSFRYPAEAELWLPFASALGQLNRSLYLLGVIARLKPEATLTQARTELEGIAQRLEQQYPETNKGRGVHLVTLHDYIVGDVKPALYVLLGAVLFVLLIACANVANLLFGRAVARQRELAIRAAMGAGRIRLLRQLLVESLLLALAGGAVGLLLALWGTNLLFSLNPDGRARRAGDCAGCPDAVDYIADRCADRRVVWVAAGLADVRRRFARDSAKR